MLKSKSKVVQHKAKVESRWITRPGLYRVRCDFGFVCAAGEKFPDAIVLRDGLLFAEADAKIWALGEDPLIDPVPAPAPNDVFDALRLQAWYSGIMRLDAEGRLMSMLNRMNDAGLGITSPLGFVIQATRS